MHQIPFGGRAPPGPAYSAPLTPSLIKGSLLLREGVWEGSGGAEEKETGPSFCGRLGQMHRMIDDRIAKQVLYWVPEDRRRRGRPHITWQHVVNRDIENEKGSGLRKECNLTADRREWRNWIAMCSSREE